MRILVTLAGLIVGLLLTSFSIGADAKATPEATPEQAATVYPRVGYYVPGGTDGKRTVYRSKRVRIVWTLSQYHVNPRYYRAYFSIRNQTTGRRIQVSCNDFTSFASSKEEYHLSIDPRPADTHRWVTAVATSCSRNPRWHTGLFPGVTAYNRFYTEFTAVPKKNQRAAPVIAFKGAWWGTVLLNPYAKYWGTGR
jgi:hypothetical protein